MDSISIDEFAPRPGALLRELKVHVTQGYGSIARGWARLFDPKMSGICTTKPRNPGQFEAIEGGRNGVLDAFGAQNMITSL